MSASTCMYGEEKRGEKCRRFAFFSWLVRKLLIANDSALSDAQGSAAMCFGGFFWHDVGGGEVCLGLRFFKKKKPRVG